MIGSFPGIVSNSARRCRRVAGLQEPRPGARGDARRPLIRKPVWMQIEDFADQWAFLTEICSMQPQLATHSHFARRRRVDASITLILSQLRPGSGRIVVLGVGGFGRNSVTGDAAFLAQPGTEIDQAATIAAERPEWRRFGPLHASAASRTFGNDRRHARASGA